MLTESLYVLVYLLFFRLHRNINLWLSYDEIKFLIYSNDSNTNWLSDV